MKKRLIAAILVIVLTVTLFPEKLMKRIGFEREAEASVILQNPRFVTDSSMVSGHIVTYDCVWFGTYPQTEIVDRASRCGTYGKAFAKITDYVVDTTLYNTLQNSDDWDSNGDIAISGVRYRRIKKSDATASYSSDYLYSWDSADTYHYFRYDPIKWRVLSSEGTQAFLLSDKGLVDMRYHTTYDAITWENSTIRSWLNGYDSSYNINGKDYSENNFIDGAFTLSEKAAINLSNVNNTDSGEYSAAYGGNDTKDKIFFLSAYDLYDSARSPMYGFYQASGDKYDEARRCLSTTYSKAMGSESSSSQNYLGCCYWWLRSPGSNPNFPACVNPSGYVSYGIGELDYTVRPALRLDLSQPNLYSYAGTVSTNGTINEDAAPTRPTYTVTYDANGGTGAPQGQTKTEEIDLTLSSQVPTRNGYTFIGWGTGSNDTSAAYSPGGIYTLDKNIVLYAIWSKTITLTYNANGGSGAPSSESTTIYNSKDSTSFIISSTTPSKSGYDFMGWSNVSNATNGSYSSGASITLSSSTTIYAIWRKNITLSYDANGGSGAPASQTGTVYNSNTNYSFTISNTIPVRDGYSFLGWSTDSNASTASYNSGGTISLSTDTLLFAVWKEEQPVYTVTYHANGGSGAPDSQEKKAGIDLTLSNVQPTRSGYSFEGWGTAGSSTTVTYHPGGVYSVDGDITLYAIWKKPIKLIYDSNGGKEEQTSITMYAYNSASSKTFDIGSYTPTRDGYDFVGWSASPDATTASYQDGDTITISTDTTIYAVWEAMTVTTYTVSYHANGGSGAPSNQTKTKGTDLTLSTIEPIRSGYTFAGWGSNASSTNVLYDAGATYTKDANIILYAIWRKGITLSYDANGGSGVPDSQSADIFNAETTYTFTISSVTPEKSGFIFTGWGISPESTSTYGSNEQITLSEDTTLYAIWSEKQAEEENVTLRYSDANGGENIPASRVVKKNSSVNLSGLIPIKEGYDFLGWNKNQNATSANYAPGDKIDITSDLTLYAIWRKTIILSYDGNGASDVPDPVTRILYNTDISSTFVFDSMVPERNGYTFLGWSSNRNAASASYAPGDEIDLSSSITFYAIWKNNSGEDGESGGDSGSTDPADPDPQPVVKKTQTITASGKTVPINNGAFSLGAKSSGNGKLSYKSSNVKAVTVSSAGTIAVKGYGIATITITAAETSSYKKATKGIKITVVPKRMKLKSVKSPKKRQLQIKWIKDKTVNGYQVQFSRDMSFKKGVYQKAISSKLAALKKPVTGLDSKKKYYVRIRAYKKVSGKILYGIWSYGKVVRIK